MDDEGTVLVWTGDTATPVSPAAPASVPVPPPAVSSPPEAERRQLTVMFCDLVDSTTLSSHLDPEEYRDVVRAYQSACTEVIQRYDGHIAQLLGDGLLVYFGYPGAHEDDAQRAVRTGLGILAAMGDRNTHLQHAQGLQLAVRLGIHTGLVVVGAMGGAGRQEQLALGETPNIAARIQGLAASNAVAISDATYRLVQGYFQCQDLGAQTLRGVTEPMRVYQVLRESGATSRLDVAHPRGLTPLVGRASEVTLLLERWEQAKAGHGQVVLVSGEAGIGKSRLVQVLKDHVGDTPHVTGNVGVQNTRRTQHSFLSLICFNGCGASKRIRLLTCNWSNWNTRSATIVCPWRNRSRCLRLCSPCLCPKTAILCSMYPHSVNGRKHSKPLSRSCWNSQSNSRCSLSWKMSLDRPHYPGVARSAGRASPDNCHRDPVDLPPPFSALLASPFVYYRNDVEPLITHPGGTDC